MSALRQEDRLKFRANLAYMVHSRSPRAVKEDSFKNQTKMKRNKQNEKRKANNVIIIISYKEGKQ